jgi:hypothetical protein
MCVKKFSILRQLNKLLYINNKRMISYGYCTFQFSDISFYWFLSVTTLTCYLIQNWNLWLNLFEKLHPSTFYLNIFWSCLSKTAPYFWDHRFFENSRDPILIDEKILNGIQTIYFWVWSSTYIEHIWRYRFPLIFEMVMVLTNLAKLIFHASHAFGVQSYSVFNWIRQAKLANSGSIKLKPIFATDQTACKNGQNCLKNNHLAYLKLAVVNRFYSILKLSCNMPFSHVENACVFRASWAKPRLIL